MRCWRSWRVLGDDPSDGPLSLRSRHCSNCCIPPGANLGSRRPRRRRCRYRGPLGAAAGARAASDWSRIGRPAVAARCFILGQRVVRSSPDAAVEHRRSSLNARGGRLSRQSAWQVLQDSADRAGVTSAVSPHTLRHRSPPICSKVGADVRGSRVARTCPVTTTQIYTLVTVHALREVWGEHNRA